MSVRQLANLDTSRIELINEHEVKITKFRHAKAELMGVKPAEIDKAMAAVESIDYKDWNFFGMFNYKACGNQKGIIKQTKWAKKRVEYLDGLPNQQGLFTDEVVVNDKCKSGYCGL